jgi:uncharacterized protein YlxW (UPF0749 family)
MTQDIDKLIEKVEHNVIRLTTLRGGLRDKELRDYETNKNTLRASFAELEEEVRKEREKYQKLWAKVDAYQTIAGCELEDPEPAPESDPK